MSRFYPNELEFHNKCVVECGELQYRFPGASLKFSRGGHPMPGFLTVEFRWEGKPVLMLRQYLTAHDAKSDGHTYLTVWSSRQLQTLISRAIHQAIAREIKRLTTLLPVQAPGGLEINPHMIHAMVLP